LTADHQLNHQIVKMHMNAAIQPPQMRLTQVKAITLMHQIVTFQTIILMTALKKKMMMNMLVKKTAIKN